MTAAILAITLAMSLSACSNWSNAIVTLQSVLVQVQ